MTDTGRISTGCWLGEPTCVFSCPFATCWMQPSTRHLVVGATVDSLRFNQTSLPISSFAQVFSVSTLPFVQFILNFSSKSTPAEVFALLALVKNINFFCISDFKLKMSHSGIIFIFKVKIWCCTAIFVIDFSSNKCCRTYISYSMWSYN